MATLVQLGILGDDPTRRVARRVQQSLIALQIGKLEGR